MKKTRSKYVKTFAISLIMVLTIALFANMAFAVCKTLWVPHPYGSIQDAIDAARDCDIVLVSNGTYYENIYFTEYNITVKSKNGAASTVIDGNASGSVVTFNSSAPSVLDGFTITNGAGNQVGAYYYGGGIYISDSSPTIKNCIIEGNSVFNYGGGIFSGDSRNPTIEYCDFKDNFAGAGGGICTTNSYATISNCNIGVENYGNTANIWGGGIMIMGRTEATVTITNCNIEYNTAIVSDSGHGGGIMIGNHEQKAVISNSDIRYNESSHNGGGMYLGGTSITSDCNITNNTSSNCGGGIWLCNNHATQGASSITDCTISDNFAPYGGGISLFYTGDKLSSIKKLQYFA